MEYTATWNGRFDSSTVRIYSYVTLPPGNYTELGIVQMLDQHLNAASYGAIHAEYDSNNNVCAIYTSSYDQQCRILTDEEVQPNITIVVIL